MNPGRILVTGATGFLGRHLVPQLLANGRHLTLAVRNAGAAPAGWRDDERIGIVTTGPIERSENLDEAFAGVSTVVHLAGLAHVGHTRDLEASMMSASAEATERLARAAVDHKVAAFIHMSSLAAVTQNASSATIDDTTCNPAPTPYGRSKQEAERHVQALASKGIFAVSLRPPLIVAADAKGNWGALQRLAITGLPLPFASVGNRRSLIGIDTVARAVAHLSTGRWSPDRSGNYCLADRESVSLSRIVTALRRGMGLPPRLFPFPPAALHALARWVGRQQMAAGLLDNLEVDASRFQRVFDFSEQKSLINSIAESGAQYRRLRSRATMESAR